MIIMKTLRYIKVRKEGFHFEMADLLENGFELMTGVLLAGDEWHK